MKVYVVEFRIPYEGGTIEAVFSTKEAADALADEKQKNETYGGYVVQEFELDKRPD